MSRATHKFKSRRDKYLNMKDKNYQRFLMPIRGQHIYKDQWAPSKGIKVTCFKDTRSEAKNTIYTRNGENALVGHVPIEISQLSQLMTNFVSYRGTCIHGWRLCKTNENHQMARTKLPFLIEITDFSRVLSEMARTKRTSGNLWPYSSCGGIKKT